MNNRYQEVKVEKSRMGRERYTHPAFGMLGFSRVSGGDQNLFGSSIEHTHKIQMTLKTAVEDRAISEDFHFGKDTIAEVEMSYSQFVECISSMNVGDGVPCTIRYTEKDGVIPMIAENNDKRRQFVNEFSDELNSAMEGIQKQIDEIRDSIANKSSLGVRDRQRIINELGVVKSKIGSNLGFCLEQFNEQMDKTVVEAKGEVEAFIHQKVSSIAMAALAERSDELTKLENPIDL